MTIKTVAFAELSSADLYIDAEYEGGSRGNASDDPISKLLPVGNQGGFRYRRPKNSTDYSMAVLYSSNEDPDWPDILDPTKGLLTYYGDNKQPGQPLEGTKRGGNRLLRHAFELAHGNRETRIKAPPFFVFTKASKGRNVIFRGLAVPGGRSIPATEDLVAIWKIKSGLRFQNYRAIFTVLRVERIARQWIVDLNRNIRLTPHCPNEYRSWVETGRYTPLVATPTVQYRTKTEQLPQNPTEEALIRTVYECFKDRPHDLERFAAEIVQLMDANVVGMEVTRPVIDGGRDAIGAYRIGIYADPITLDFALEAKCYSLDTSVGVTDVSRLISRLRYRQFGVLVTTSYVAAQAYKEIREDGHPVLIIAARDIARILLKTGHRNPSELWRRLYPDN